MPKSSFQKKRILFLRDMFLERTDENHPITMDEIISLLSANGMETSARTISDDIALLQDMGLDIIAQKMPITKYYIGIRDFEPYEVRLLMDCVQSSKVLSESKTEQLIKKLSGLCSKHEAARIKTTIFDKGIKSANDKTHFTISVINQAMIEGKQITFKYFEYSPSKSKQYENDGKAYEVIPCELIYVEGTYHLLALKARSAGYILRYKIDQMEEVTLSDDQPKYTGRMLERSNMNDYHKHNFSLFGGKIERVTIQFPNHLTDTVIDRFGLDVDIKEVDTETFQITERIAINPQFFGWVFGLGLGIKIVSPASVAQQMKDLLKDAYQTYTVPRKRRKVDETS